MCEDKPKNNVKCDFTQVEKFLQPRQNVTKKWHAKRDSVLMFKSSDFLRRPQNVKQSFTWFDVYLVNFKSSGRLFQIVVAFSECPNFKTADTLLIARIMK